MVSNGATSTSITLSITGIRLIILPKLATNVCVFSVGNKVLHRVVTNKYKKHKKQNQKDQQTVKCFH